VCCVAQDEESQKVVAVLQERVSKLGREATAAQDALRAANTRVQFFFRVMNRLMEREKEAQRSAEEASRRLAAAAAEVDGVRKKDVLLTRAWQMAREKTHLLTLQLDSVELMQAEALVLADSHGLLTSPGPEVSPNAGSQHPLNALGPRRQCHAGASPGAPTVSITQQHALMHHLLRGSQQVGGLCRLLRCRAITLGLAGRG